MFRALLAAALLPFFAAAIAIKGETQHQQKSVSLQKTALFKSLNKMFLTSNSKMFITKCEQHLVELTGTVDKHYTDMQLEELLENECQLAKEQPLVTSDGFKSATACNYFITQMVKARADYLHDGDMTGFTRVSYC